MINKRSDLISLIVSDLNRIKIPRNKLHCLLLIFRYAMTSKGFKSVLLYRILSSNCLLKFLLYPFNNVLSNIEISDSAIIGYGLLIPHAQCIVIGSSTIIGNNVTIQQGVTIGSNLQKRKGDIAQPTIGDNVFIGAGAKILGPISIGHNSLIGANAVVLTDIPNDSIATGIPAKPKHITPKC